MFRANVRKGRVRSPLLVAALMGAATPVLLPATQADAAPRGRVCLFQNQQGANGAGHVAWALRDPHNSAHWLWGSTDSINSAPKIDAGRRNGSWIQGGTWKEMRGEARGKKKPIGLRTYDYYRCINTAGGNLAAAQKTYKHIRGNGYALLNNNCLTKALEIFRSYSSALTGAHLPSGQFKSPNYYFTTSLNKSRGWEKARVY
ncbi:Tat pathway signal protein [Streptomyces sp. NPDC001893]|uniref:Tat pathway signal protein n=1 Tax=unclassified Streptomyces TaxID=2593676 RepID=UPI00332B4524